MEPIGLELDHGEKVIRHRCKSCGFERRQRAASNDNEQALIDLLRQS